MRRICLLITCWGLVGLSGYCPETGFAADDAIMPTAVGQSGREARDCDDLDCCGCCRCRGPGCRSGICSRCRGKFAEYGYFNCSCRGSYKFPVPPQFTYHWPGMYSQQTITEHNSPWRFPALKLPQDVPSLADEAPGVLAPAGEPGGLLPLGPSPVPEAPSKKIKRALGIQ